MNLLKPLALGLCLLNCGCLSIFMPVTPALIEDHPKQRPHPPQTPE